MKLCFVTELSAIVGDKVAYLIKLLESKPDSLLLRAKHLQKEDYEALLLTLLPYAEANGVELLINHQPELARKHNLKVQISVHELEKDLSNLSFGVAVHALEEAKLAKAKGAEWLVFGHLFPTSCKVGLAPREMSEFEQIIDLGVPTYGIGGIKLERLSLLAKGAEGVYIMRDSMVQKEPKTFTKAWRSALEKFK